MAERTTVNAATVILLNQIAIMRTLLALLNRTSPIGIEVFRDLEEQIGLTDRILKDDSMEHIRKELVQ